MHRNLDVELRLGEITRRSAELSAISSKLTDMALQLDRLRRLNGRTELMGNSNRLTSRRYGRDTGHKFQGNSGEAT
jgi:hypothetical protein